MTEEVENEFLIGIFRAQKTGLPFQMFLCSRKFSAGMTQKVVFHLLSNWIFRKILVNGKQPIYLIHGPRRGLIGT